MKRRLPVVLAMIVLPWLAGSGCPGNPVSEEVFTTVEKTALDSARMSAASLFEAAGVTQTPAGAVNNAATVPGELSFGTCPVVTTTVGQGAVDLSINFGTTPCVPAVFPDLTCTGSAVGTFNAGASTIAITLNAIGCNGKSLNGAAAVNFSLSQAGVGLEGTFDLMWLADGIMVSTNGAGQFQYNHTAQTTTVPSFSGTLTCVDGTYSTVCTGLVVSYQNNANLIPSAGTIELFGEGIRSLVITFNENSPITGLVQITINGRETVEVNILDP